MSCPACEAGVPLADKRVPVTIKWQDGTESIYHMRESTYRKLKTLASPTPRAYSALLRAQDVRDVEGPDSALDVLYSLAVELEREVGRKVPEGYKVVPEKPTRKMVLGMLGVSTGRTRKNSDLVAIYQAAVDRA